jgi:probable HAF family extracellular repeat protein
MHCRLLGMLATFCIAAGLAFGSATTSAQNLLTDLGPGTAFGINNSGEVVLSNGIWSNGTVTAFPTGFSGTAINASGQVAGALVANGVEGAAFYSNGTVTLIGANSDPTLAISGALGINDNGVVVGQGSGNGGQYIYAFIYNGQLSSLGTLPGSAANTFGFTSQANGVNNAGLVTGSAINNSGFNNTVDAFIYDITGATWTDLGPGAGVAINASGQVLLGGAIYSNGTTTQIPIFGNAINATAQVVGRNFFYSGGIIDLNNLVNATDPLKPYVTLNFAVGINDSLLVVVNGVDSRTQLNHAYLVQAPWITISPGPLTFPSQIIGTVSSAQTITVTNAGATALPIDSVSTSGDFLQTNNCGPSLAPSGTCAVMVTFGPTAAGARTGNLTVTTNSVPVTVPLSGTAPVQVTISSSATTTAENVPVKLTWTASPGSTCTATGGTSADGWVGTIAITGTQSVAESSGGAYEYGLSCVAGSQSASSQVSVVVNWPVVSVSLTASPASFTAGQSITLKWSSANATSCTATGGGADDMWPGSKATSGSSVVTEPYAPAGSSLTLTFSIECMSSVSGLSAIASAKSIENAVAPAPTPTAPAAMSGGGGALDSVAVLFLAGVAALRRSRHSSLHSKIRAPQSDLGNSKLTSGTSIDLT